MTPEDIASFLNDRMLEVWCRACRRYGLFDLALYFEEWRLQGASPVGMPQRQLLQQSYLMFKLRLPRDARVLNEMWEVVIPS